MPIRIAIDCMGGDRGLPVTVAGALAALEHAEDLELQMVGATDAVRAALGRHADHPRVAIVNATEVVSMAEQPKQAFRKRDSSMRVAINQVKSGAADACVSAGNTGALMMTSYFVLSTLDGIERPAIASAIPNQKGGVTTMLDLGANAECEPAHLVQFALMGCALVAAVEGRSNPSVGLLNIGEEDGKGHDEIRQAGELLKASGLNYRGNVEGNDIFRGTTDVVVCDGFTGNVVLKTAEGLAQMLGGFLKEEYTRGLFSKLGALVSLPVLRRFKARVDHRRYNGACLLGLRGLVIKSHGSADAFAFECAVRRGYDAAKNGVLPGIVAGMASFRATGSPQAGAATQADDRSRGTAQPPSASLSPSDLPASSASLAPTAPTAPPASSITTP